MRATGYCLFIETEPIMRKIKNVKPVAARDVVSTRCPIAAAMIERGVRGAGHHHNPAPKRDTWNRCAKHKGQRFE